MSRNGRRFAGWLAVVVAMGLMAPGCASTLRLGANQEIPAAEGKVKFNRTKNGNTAFEVRVKHLAPPDRIVPGTSVFVVWVRGFEAGAPPQNVGALRVDKNLKGKLKGITPLTGFDMFVTCEVEQAVTAPSSQELLPVRYEGK